ncbi:MAG: hypothetical protein E4H02_03665 [Lentisphaerales bacterium]|jgi:protein arginine kinase activator|nr:MAG: hypothetical protein E4H02_03665 [Lentisphaerales bacterium]
MLCESCGEYEANVHLSHEVNGVVRKVNLCEECAEKSGISMQGPLSIADILSNLGPEDDESLEDRSKSCSFCRITLGEFKRTSRLGCPVCYESFKKETETVVDGYQHASKHAGKMPAHYAANREKEAVLDPLRRTLQEAIAAEQYEEAARIRDEIRLEETKG